jgi:hypothetical protein
MKEDKEVPHREINVQELVIEDMQRQIRKLTHRLETINIWM